MGHLGENELAANQLVMQYVAFFVSISFAMAQAITVRAGNQLGAKRPAAAKRAVFAGLLISVGIIFLVVVLERLFPEQLFALDLSRQHAHSSAVILLAINFLSVAIFFQFVEAARIGLFGALRGYKDTRFALFSTFIAFGCVALPLGFCFADIFALGAVAYWYGLTISAMINLSLLFIRYRYLLRKTRFA
jgi:MATE family multidrug resistance protein